ncbi:MAG: TonB-dependent receptor [Marinoscillum sp.]
MKANLRKNIFRVSKISTYAIIFFYSLSMTFASETFSQYKNLNEIEVEVTLPESTSLLELISIIEDEGQFTFVYSKKELKNIVLDLQGSYQNMEELLSQVSVQAKVSIKRVNETITLKASKQPDKVPTIEEVLPETISGRVTDENGEPLPGATILVKGTQNGTVSDVDGNFSLNVNDGDVLIVSFVGYRSKEIAVSGQTQFNIALDVDASSLQEVVVIGYGEQVKSEISGSVSTVSVERISQNPSGNLSNSLVGNTPGIIATQPSGAPGSDAARVLIRGVGTNGVTDPLYVIDGIVRSSSDFFQLNPSEIESVSILKDAASAAVFGMRAGNGVILVTTKRGREGKMQISYSGNFGIQERTREPDFLNSYEYAQLRNEALANAGQPAEYTDDDLQKYQDGSSPDTHPDTNWLDLLNDTAPIQQHNISANGGSDKVRYATSLSYLSQDGITPSDNFGRFNFRSNIDADVTKTTRFSFDLSGRKQRSKTLGKSDELFRWVNTQPNKAPLRFSNGGVASGPAYIALQENGYRNEEQEALRTRMEIHQQVPFIDGLSFKLIGSYDKTNRSNKNWYYPVEPFYIVDGTGNLIAQDLPANYLDVNSEDDQSTTFQTHLLYDRTFGNVDISGLILYTQTERELDYISAHREGFTIAIDELFNGASENRNNTGYSRSFGRQGVVGRLNVKLANKYIFETSVRVDGSEQFAPNQRWGVFPSVSGAYIISEESFMSDVSFLDFFKLRASYGILGNDRISDNPNDRFLYLQSYNVGEGRYPNVVFGEGDVYPTIWEGRLASPNVTWESVEKFDIGFDAFVLDGKLSITFDYFYDKRSDILGTELAKIPDVYGIVPGIKNVTRVDNRGVEVSLGYEENVTPDLSFSVNGNMTYAKNEVVDTPEPEDINPNLSRIGHPLGMEFGYRAMGIFQSPEEVNDWPTQPGTAPGDIRMADVNGDGVVNEDDRVAVGVTSADSNVPNYIFGLNGQVHYKNFSFTFLFQGATGVNQYTCCEGTWPFFGDASTVRSNLDYWTPDNRDAANPRILPHPTNNLNHDLSSFWMKDASYLRLKNMEIAYNVPVQGIEFIQSLRLYVNANNIATWTKIENWDPEYADDRSWTYPQLRVWNGGFNVRF